jgi:hypothetical protein
MKVKNKDWIDFKKRLISIMSVVEREGGKFTLPLEDAEEFSIIIDGCEVLPVFVKKNDLQRVEYDFSLCNTKIRTIAFSTYLDATRIEITLKRNII